VGSPSFGRLEKAVSVCLRITDFTRAMPLLSMAPDAVVFHFLDACWLLGAQ
jgi:hypothetical protein